MNMNRATKRRHRIYGDKKSNFTHMKDLHTHMFRVKPKNRANSWRKALKT